MTRMYDARLNLWIDPQMLSYYASDATDELENDGTLLTTNVDIRIYATNINILRIIGGLGGLAYK